MCAGRGFRFCLKENIIGIQTMKLPSLGFHRVCSLIGRPANLLSAVECGRGSGRKGLGDERVGRQRETVRSGKFVEGSEGEASEIQSPNLKYTT